MRSVDVMESVVLAGRPFDAPPGATGPVLLMLSPGRDSACLLDLAVRRLGANAVVGLHVDHGLRPNSPAEADAVRAAGAGVGVHVVVRQAVGAPGSSRHSGDGMCAPSASHHSSDTANVHAWARAERARLATEEAIRLGARAVATAHTRSDLVETALFRLSTQPGRRALLAMRAREPDAFGVGIDLVRPLLGLGRDETLAWSVARGLRWVDDPSNADRRFARARLRHSVTPVLRSLNPRFEEAVVRTLGELEEERDALDAIVDSVLPPDRDTVAVVTLLQLPRPIGRLVIRTLCERAVGLRVARASTRLDELLARATSDPSPFQLDVGDGARLAVRQGIVRCVASEGPAARR